MIGNQLIVRICFLLLSLFLNKLLLTRHDGFSGVFLDKTVVMLGCLVKTGLVFLAGGKSRDVHQL